MSYAADVEECRAILRRGSKSFFAASRLLPAPVRDPVAVVYAFCRISDDAIDESHTPEVALGELHERLTLIFNGAPIDDPVDRALATVVRAHGLPLRPFEALLDGYAWDAENRRYHSLAELRAYCVRVASSVGVIMSMLLGERRRVVLARACDLGVAMQLTNIARDVGEDARDGRVYLPLDRLAGVGIEQLGPEPRFSPELGGVVRELLAEAARLYRRADDGIRQLPRSARPAIGAASAIYEDIGRAIVARGYDSVSSRAFTSGPRKLVHLLRASALATLPPSRPSKEPALDEAEFLIESFS
jgi:phytoene synthase